MNKQELITTMSGISGLTKGDSEKALNAFMESVQSALATGEKVKLVGFGSFEARERAAKPEREGRNVKTGEIIILQAKPAYLAPVFKAGKKLKEVVNQ